ncbi:RNA polymerase sigma factor [Dactylosporangium sp. CA-092794]|uniref:RNA polymerase sigma factor n=1 Tax=Dactylosporangium sp. CA-092794 TaxID=3239929 RepID=UPI003D93B633
MDAELARAARSGDDGAFAVLIQQHLAGMRAVAIALLGYVDEAEDVVQDAVLVALRSLPQLRDPEAAGAWLRSIVRNNCRMLLRSRRAVPVAEPALLMPAADGLDPAAVLDRAATRDWVHHAVAALPEPVRDVAVLRYFSDYSSYRQIAELCAVPEHTVRSRLRDGRRALGRVLRDTAAVAHADSGAMATATRHEAEAAIQAGLHGDLRRVIGDRFHPDARVTMAGLSTGGMSVLVPMMDDTLGAGVSLRLVHAAASGGVVLWEIEFLNPAHDPQHCPPAMAWLHTLRQGRTERLRVAYRPAPLD